MRVQHDYIGSGTHFPRPMLQLRRSFELLTGSDLKLRSGFLDQLTSVEAALVNVPLRNRSDRDRDFIRATNKKFGFNADGMSILFANAAKAKTSFNFHEKRQIQHYIDGNDKKGLQEYLHRGGVTSSVVDLICAGWQPLTNDETLQNLMKELNAPSKLRIDQGKRDIAGDIQESLFAAYLWCSYETMQLHELFAQCTDSCQYVPDFWQYLLAHAPDVYRRDNALQILICDQVGLDNAGGLQKYREVLSAEIARAFVATTNYGYLALRIGPLFWDGIDVRWELQGDLVLFAEKHKQEQLSAGFFKPDQIEMVTVAHNPNVDSPAAHFELANFGFTYQDCFVVQSGISEDVQTTVLVFQKNLRDETLIPCPTCRSSNVRGNSYPALGVKSWECNNGLCPDRSKYGRGKRYSFKGLAMQHAIDDIRNEIPSDHIKRWSRDVLKGVSDQEVIEMLIRHYSFIDDTVVIKGVTDNPAQAFGRHLQTLSIDYSSRFEEAFSNNSMFARYCYPKTAIAKSALSNLGNEEHAVYCGDSSQVLQSIASNSVDAAVTSPPYYNAREYSQWPNIYCYLNDILAVATQVYRVLKPGARYWFNIFDYFDNENTVATSAMGDKRMILSSYAIDLFRRVGFRCVGNVVWDKGNIEGKRAFNAGNESPYYQAPFNCWEHILVFEKPGVSRQRSFNSVVWKQDPVRKIFKGVNTYGHSAPYPIELPLLAISDLPKGSLVLDPYAGSLTTARAAKARGLRSICVELSEEYCKLGLSMLNTETLWPAD
jgi:DNA modification methylase